MKFFITIFIIIYCSTTSASYSINKHLAKWKKNYSEFYSKDELNNLTIKIKKLDLPDVGLCVRFNATDLLDKNKTIIISSNIFKDYSDKKIESVIFHELTHCLCNYYDHDDRKYSDGCPMSVMNTYVIDDKCLNKYEDEYKKDMKEKCQIKLNKKVKK